MDSERTLAVMLKGALTPRALGMVLFFSNWFWFMAVFDVAHFGGSIEDMVSRQEAALCDVVRLVPSSTATELASAHSVLSISNGELALERTFLECLAPLTKDTP